MFHLIWKDFVVQKKTLLFILIYFLVISVYFTKMGFFLPFITVFIVYSLMLGSMQVDEQYHIDVLMNSLPVKRWKIVAAKYASIFLYCIGAFLFLLLNYFVLSQFRDGFQTNMIKQYCVAIGGLLFFTNFILPIYYKFGLRPTRYVFFIIFFLVFFTGNLMDKKLLSTFINKVTHLTTGFTLSLFACGLLVTLIISFVLSIKIYNQRDFS
ncbi:ABC-2 transporter permease [Bacillus sp. 03113]|uniref:ABC-2 transporter permease n=1 Tax=Bacillus sp. 03113 TaxID=2578211 RepID=UPI0011433E9C|nr:ABC-2 transporter permease [Bacillus sp. 03113]